MRRRPRATASAQAKPNPDACIRQRRRSIGNGGRKGEEEYDAAFKSNILTRAQKQAKFNPNRSSRIRAATTSEEEQVEELKTHLKMLKFYELPYDATALEPVISADTMQTHHNKHYKGYYDKMLEEMAHWASGNIEQMMEGDKWSASEKLAENFGGYLNPQIFGSCSDPPKALKSHLRHLRAYRARLWVI